MSFVFNGWLEESWFVIEKKIKKLIPIETMKWKYSSLASKQDILNKHFFLKKILNKHATIEQWYVTPIRLNIFLKKTSDSYIFIILQISILKTQNLKIDIYTYQHIALMTLVTLLTKSIDLEIAISSLEMGNQWNLLSLSTKLSKITLSRWNHNIS